MFPENSLVLIATGLESGEIDGAVESLRAQGIDAANGLYLAKAVETPVQIFIAWLAGQFGSIFQKYVEKRAELAAQAGEENVRRAEKDSSRERSSIEFAETLYEALPPAAFSAKNFSIGISQHGPWGVHLWLDATNRDETIERIAWMARNAESVELALSRIIASGRKAFGQYRLEPIGAGKFTIEWKEFEPASHYKAVHFPEAPLTVVNQDTGESYVI